MGALVGQRGSRCPRCGCEERHSRGCIVWVCGGLDRHARCREPFLWQSHDEGDSVSPPSPSPGRDDVVRRWFADVEVVGDLSWGLIDTIVPQVRHAEGESIIKAAGPEIHHLGREIAAHEQWPAHWRDDGRPPRVLHAVRSEAMLSTTHVPGQPGEGPPSCEAHRQAGELLAPIRARRPWCRRTMSVEWMPARSPGWAANTTSTPSPRPGFGTRSRQVGAAGVAGRPDLEEVFRSG